MKYQRILVASMPRTGSMWLLNVCRELVVRSGLEYWPDEAFVNPAPVMHEAYSKELPEGVVACLKMHGMKKLDPDSTGVIVPYRDLRGALLSFMRFTRYPFEQAVKFLPAWVSITEHYERQVDCGDVLMVRFEDATSQPARTIARIGEFVQADCDEQACEEIARKLDRKHVRKMTNALQPAVMAHSASAVTIPNSDGTVRLMDRRTGFQTGHVTSQRDDEWREALTPAQQQAVCRLAGPWLIEHGYEVP